MAGVHRIRSRLQAKRRELAGLIEELESMLHGSNVSSASAPDTVSLSPLLCSVASRCHCMLLLASEITTKSPLRQNGSGRS